MAEPKRAKVFRAMHEKGFTYEEIGELFGISRQAVWETATKSKNGFNESAVRKIKYVGLKDWMMANKVCIRELERRCSDKLGYDIRLSSMFLLLGSLEPVYIDAILAATGLTYEDCFREECAETV